jgi:hypothetical protein
MLVADVLADDCKPYKCYFICSLTSYEKRKKNRNHRSRKYRIIMHIEASTQTAHPFAEAENKTFLLFVNVKLKKLFHFQSK